jgi:hypothetical protein
MRSSILIAASLVMHVATSAGAQSLASRVAQAPDGLVRLQFDARAGTCGDGSDVIGYRNAMFARNFQSIGGHYGNMRCVAGPLRVALDVDDGQVTRVHTQVGGAWRPTDSRVTDLGVVSSREASAYFFSLVPRLETSGGKDRLLLPAVLADGAEVTAPLLALARDESRARSTRSQAIQWLGLMDEFAVLRTLYSRLETDELKESVFAGMAQDESAEGGRWILDRVRDDRGSTRLRRSALFWAGQREATPTAELVRFYRDGGDTDFREHAIFVLSQRKDDAATDALIDIAKNDSDTRMRGKALFWLAQKDDPRVTKLIADLILK